MQNHCLKCLPFLSTNKNILNCNAICYTLNNNVNSVNIAQKCIFNL